MDDVFRTAVHRPPFNDMTFPQTPDYQALPGSARIWIYQANRPFPAGEIPVIREWVDRFAQNWVSHNRQLRAFGDVLHERFIVLLVDESQADASGCSIDKSVHFLQQLGQKYGVDLFDRLTFAWLDGDTVRSAQRGEFAELYAAGAITAETPVFDPLVKTKAEFEAGWIKPLGKSWHRRMI